MLRNRGARSRHFRDPAASRMAVRNMAMIGDPPSRIGTSSWVRPTEAVPCGMPNLSADAPRRRTQAQRRAATKNVVLEATIDCLVQDGYHRLTTGRVADRAGVSRGAQLHQYPTRQQLVVAAVEHLTELRAAELRAAADRLPSGADRMSAVLDLLWSQFSGRLFQAGVELLAAGRTDAALREALVPFERQLRRINRGVLDREIVGLVVNAIYGAALLRVVQPNLNLNPQRDLLERVVRMLLG
jgi:AcrR family transcriptional regulator